MVPIKPVFLAPQWSVFFVYCPDGVLTSSQRFSLHRLRDLNVPLMIVVTTREVGAVPHELVDLGQALYWKALPGYDFSAYTIALEAIAADSPAATVFLMNDSVYGPFQDLRAQAFSSPWALTGWTACGKFENHLQSYAFSIRDVTAARLEGLRSVFFRRFALTDPLDVILCQETRMARVAARSMSTGALWRPADPSHDAPIDLAFELLVDDFPFLKKSLLGKYLRLQHSDEVYKWLQYFQHPLKD